MEPVDVGDLPRFLAAIEPIARDLAAGDIMGALMRRADLVIEATAIGAGVDRAWLEKQKPDVLVDLAAQVVEVNADFFARVVLPLLMKLAERLAPILSGGMSGSHGSSGQDTATPM